MTLRAFCTFWGINYADSWAFQRRRPLVVRHFRWIPCSKKRKRPLLSFETESCWCCVSLSISLIELLRTRGQLQLERRQVNIRVELLVSELV